MNYVLECNENLHWRTRNVPGFGKERERGGIQIKPEVLFA